MIFSTSWLIFSTVLFSMLVSLVGLLLSVYLGPLSALFRVLSGFLILIPFFYILYCQKKVNIKYALLLSFFLMFSIYMLALNIVNKYGVIAYLYNLPSYVVYFSMLPIIQYLYHENNKLFIKISNLYVWIVIFMMVGLLLDHFYDLNRLIGLRVILDADSTRRASFLLASPTACFIVGISGFLVYWASFQKRSTCYDISFLFLIIIASFYSFSRLPLFLAICALLCYFAFNKSSIRVKLFLVLLLVSVILYNFDHIMLFGDYVGKFMLIFDGQDDGNSQRFDWWASGLKTFTSFSSFFGNGFGAGSINLAEQLGFEYIGHFESSLLLMWTESGVFGVLIFLFLCALLINQYGIFPLSVCLLILLNILTVPLYGNYQVPFCILFTLSVLRASSFKNNESYFNQKESEKSYVTYSNETT